VTVNVDELTNTDELTSADELTDADGGAWDDFVRGSPEALPHHLLGWRDVIGRTYGYRPRYLVAKEAGDVVGVMPLFEVRSRIEGYHLSTLPGGLCASSDEAGLALVRRAAELVRSTNARFLAIRDSRRKWAGDLVSYHSQCSVMVDVSGGLAAVRKRMPSSVRQHLAKGSKSGVELSCGSPAIESFYEVLSAFLRSRGTPVFPKRFLTGQADVFRADTNFVNAFHERRQIGGALDFVLGGNVFSILLFSLDEYHKVRTNHVLYWDLFELAVKQGLRRIDLGRSTIGSGTYNFKMSWRGIPVPIYQQFWLNRTRSMPYVADDAKSGNGRLFTRVWRRIPVPITRVVGPIIRRELPFV
jgi:FemAB-related protein (PEP-CTERM system-associated)